MSGSMRRHDGARSCFGRVTCERFEQSDIPPVRSFVIVVSPCRGGKLSHARVSQGQRVAVGFFP